jgi:hypothetical protein
LRRARVGVRLWMNRCTTSGELHEYGGQLPSFCGPREFRKVLVPQALRAPLRTARNLPRHRSSWRLREVPGSKAQAVRGATRGPSAPSEPEFELAKLGSGETHSLRRTGSVTSGLESDERWRTWGNPGSAEFEGVRVVVQKPRSARRGRQLPASATEAVEPRRLPGSAAGLRRRRPSEAPLSRK